jgi:predicted Zn finger-like uncharacterized protein
VSSATFICPSCQSRLQLGQAPAPGRRIRCPKCGQTFAPALEANEVEPLEEGEESPRRQSLTTSVPTPAGRPELDEEEGEAEVVRPRRKKRKKKSSMWVVWTAACLLAIGGGVFLILTLQKQDKDDAPRVTLGVGRKAKDPAEALKQLVAVKKEISYRLRQVSDRKSAERVRPRLKELREELTDCESRLKEFGKEALTRHAALVNDLDDASAQLEAERATAFQIEGVREVLQDP